MKKKKPVETKRGELKRQYISKYLIYRRYDAFQLTKDTETHIQKAQRGSYCASREIKGLTAPAQGQCPRPETGEARQLPQQEGAAYLYDSTCPMSVFHFVQKVKDQTDWEEADRAAFFRENLIEKGGEALEIKDVQELIESYVFITNVCYRISDTDCQQVH